MRQSPIQTFPRHGKEAIVTLGHAQDRDLKVQIRWLIRRDMEEVLEIERASFEFAWTEEDFLTCLRQRNCIGMVAERNHKIVGFMVYELHKSRLRILNFAVSRDARREGVGTQMVQRLVDKLSQQRRKEIILEVRETNLAAQLFFKKQAFRAVCVLRNHYDDTTEDAYYMQYRLVDENSFPAEYAPRNRISEFDAA
jgi:ribosomal-protein-alanine N-acetyltransferase